MAENTIQERKDLLERIEQLEKVLTPFANAYERIQHFGAPTSDANLGACDNTYYELFADEGEDKGKDPQSLLRVGHLEDAASVLRGK